MRPRHPKDGPHRRNWWHGGAIRYSRKRPTRFMGRSRMSGYWKELARRVDKGGEG